jgi:hypothetical protein
VVAGIFAVWLLSDNAQQRRSEAEVELSTSRSVLVLRKCRCGDGGWGMEDGQPEVFVCLGYMCLGRRQDDGRMMELQGLRGCNCKLREKEREKMGNPNWVKMGLTGHDLMAQFRIG